MSETKFFGTTIKVPFLNGETAKVTLTKPVDNPVMVDGENLGNDLKCFAVVQLGNQKFGRFTVIENLVARDNFRVGNIWVGVPKFNGEPAIKDRRVDQMRIAARIAYMACSGVHPNLVRYSQEDRYGQTCKAGCDHLQKPGRGNSLLACKLGIREDVDTAEEQLKHDDIINRDNGGKSRYFRAFTQVIEDYDVLDVDMTPWFKSIESLDQTLETICIGLKADLGLQYHLKVYPFFRDKQVLDDMSIDGEVDHDKLIDLLERHDAQHNLGRIFVKLLYGEMLTHEDYDRFPKTISHFMAMEVPEEKGFRMEFISTDMLEAYGLDSQCPYGSNDHHRNGFLTHQIEMAMDIRHGLIGNDHPLIATSVSTDLDDFKGFLAVNVDQALFAPRFDIEELSTKEFITKYVKQLRDDFPTIKPALKKVLSAEKVVVVDDEECYKKRSGAGFEVIDDQIEIINNSDICKRHVFAWMLSKVSKDHTLAAVNR